MSLTPSGVLVVDKPAGVTSHDVVAQARRLFGTRDVGHAGTLDPMATGVLLLLLGQAKKLSLYLTADVKRYEALVNFGRSTTTLDAEGSPIEELTLSPGWLSVAALEAAMVVERARVLQIPPAFSAIKVDGKRAHALSRAGQELELEPRSVRTLELKLLDWADDHARFDLTVSKGYYVRSFARDLGATLAVPAHLGALRRVASGGFTLAEASRWPPAEPPTLLSVADAVGRCLPSLTLTADGELRARQGKLLGRVHLTAESALPALGEPTAWFSAGGDLVAIGERVDDDTLRVKRGFSGS